MNTNVSNGWVSADSVYNNTLGGIGGYTGTKTTYFTIDDPQLGEWIEIGATGSFKLQYFSMRPIQGGDSSEQGGWQDSLPRQMVICGKNDPHPSIAWDTIASIVCNPPTYGEGSQNHILQPAILSTTAYKYHRFIVRSHHPRRNSSTDSFTFCSIGKLRLFGYTMEIAEKYLAYRFDISPAMLL